MSLGIHTSIGVFEFVIAISLLAESNILSDIEFERPTLVSLFPLKPHGDACFDVVFYVYFQIKIKWILKYIKMIK